MVIKPADFKEFGDAQFAWQVSGVRNGYENEEIIVDAGEFLKGNGSSETVSEKRAAIDEKIKKIVEKVKKEKKNNNK